jgi:ketosteroid isomerase-like protein
MGVFVRRAWLTLFSLLLACGGTGTVAITDRAQIVEAVTGRLTLWSRAVNNRSLDTLALVYAHSRDLAITWPEGDQTRGWNDISKRLKAWADSLTQLNFVMRDPQVDVIDHEVAVATFRTSTDVVIGGERIKHSGPITQVWVRDPADNKWRISVEHRSVVPQH